MFKRVATVSLMVLVLSASLGVHALSGDEAAECLACHSARGLSKKVGEKQVPLHVDPDVYRESVHGKLLCAACHIDFEGQGFPHKRAAEPVECSRCHGGRDTVGAPDYTRVQEYADSIHGKAARRGDPDAPKCADCHGRHDIRAADDPKSSIYRANIADTCGKCHTDSTLTARHKIPAPEKVRKYKGSVHGKAVAERGILVAAACTDCHGVHLILAAKDPGSTVAKAHIPETCGRCHGQLYGQYKEGIHGKALAKGVKDAPACTDCHGEHTIARPSEPRSSVYPTHVVATCSRCHDNVRIEQKYGLPAKRLGSYIESYHGVAYKYGDTSVANCATCHGAHDIRPSSDPKSAVHKRNLAKTCGGCHPNASANFAKGNIHVFPSRQRDIGVYWVSIFYRMFIAVLVASFCVYISLDLLAWRRGKIRRGRSGGGSQ